MSQSHENTGLAAVEPGRAPIRVLSPLVASQIAAGEVVERPASVVKELIENALDAGSSRITLELEQGGIELIRISDDGKGIASDQLHLAIAPHATSKISQASDLDKIGTLGFRGEALASIASVSRMSIKSRTAQDEGASVIEVEGVTAGTPKPTAGAVGTTVTVRNLFFNTPARRKFLRTVGTEQEKCLEVFKQVALAHPGVGFTAIVDGRTVQDVPVNQTPRERALSVLGKDLGSQLLDVHADEFDDSRGVALWGLAGLPSIARGSNKHQYIFINGRPIRDRTIQHAVAEAYRGLIEPSRYPTVLLMLEMSAGGVDVNVHPQKTEVRFRDGSLIHSVVLRAVREALKRADLTPAYSAIAAGQRGHNLMPGPLDVSLPSDLPGSGQTSGQGYGEGGMGAAGGVGGFGADAGGTQGSAISKFVDYFKRGQGTGGSSRFDYEAIKHEMTAQPQAHEQQMRDQQLLDAKPQSRVLQVHKSYLFTQDDQGVVIIDQHALHERVMFEYLLARVMNQGLESQHLLAPAVVEVTATQVEALASLKPLLEKIGVVAEQSGPMTVSVHAFPSFLFDRGVDPVEFMMELFEKAESSTLLTDLKRGGEQAMRDVLDMMSCKAAVKAGDRMSDIELHELVKLRQEVERSSNCPHGRPTSIRLTIKELEKLFGRT